jgi:cardiolipin synthase C
VKLFVGIVIVCCVIAVVSFFGFRLAYPLPAANHEAATYRISPAWDTEVGALLEAAVRSHPGQTGIRPLTDGKSALAARMLLAREAERSIDAQYYIWHGDTTGLMLLDELRQAAERGVRVRLLVDDNGIHGLDSELAALDAMPSAEVRIFNPFTLRNPKLLSYLFDFRRLNRRMHNKSITFDGYATIIGGRNIGDIYFEYGKGVHYVDVDILAVGDIVDKVAASFDDYWNSSSVYAAKFVLAPFAGGTEIIAVPAEMARNTAKGAGYENAISEIDLAKMIEARHVPFEWTEVELFADPPSKGLGAAMDEELLVGNLVQFADQAKTSIDMVSAYFVPGKLGMEVFTRAAERGISIRALTNSLEATDVPPVYGAYMRQRSDMLDIGVRLLELKALGEAQRKRTLPEFLAGSASSLHAKVISLDRERAFVGSYNLDPRSAWLNCEMGFLIESPSLALWISETLDNPTFAYEIQPDGDGGVRWIERDENGNQYEYDAEPNVSTFQRTLVWITSYLPIRWLL